MDAQPGGAEHLATNHCYKPGITGFWDNACNAFDGNPKTATGAGKTWDGAQGMLAADFGKIQAITKVILRYQPGGDPNPGYRIEVSDDGRAWKTVRDVSKPPLKDTQDNLNTSGRYLRVFSKHFGFDPWWMHSVAEIEVW